MTARWTVVASCVVLSMPMATIAAQDTAVVVRRGAGGFQASRFERRAIDVFNALNTIRVVGALTVERGTRYAGDVAVLDGPVVVEGVVEGSLIAINADAVIRAGARVDGDVLVVGGRLEDEAGADVRGTMRRQSSHVAVRLVEEQLVLVQAAAPDTTRRRARRRYPVDGGASILLGFEPTYNRVEGLPLHLGAKIALRHSAYDATLRGYGVFRTAGGFKGNRQDIGYNIEGLLRVGRRRTFTIGGRAFDVVVPTQDWPLERHEVGWGSFLWHRDYRDYYLQRGVAGILAVAVTRRLTLSAEVARVDETSIAERDPWTLFRNSDVWRPNPAIDAGDYTLLSAGAEFESRPPRRGRGSGWLLRLRWDRGIGDDVVQRPLPLAIRDPLPTQGFTYDRASVDARRYQRIGWAGQLRLRAFWAGSVGSDPLPIQRRFSLGGPDPLNGYGFRTFACNPGVGDPAQPGLCDHVLLLQAEYRGGLGLDWFSNGRDRRTAVTPEPDWWDWHEWFWFEGPTLVLFGNAGTGWLDGEDLGSLHYDLGAGVEWGGFGFYVAKALESGEPVRATLRLERRF
jgi:hypothetical protein